MKTPEEIYVNGLKKHFRHFFAAWPVNEPLKLGDVGILDGNFFIRLRDLKAPDLDISFRERPGSSSSPINIVSEQGVTIVTKFAGELNTSMLPTIPEGEIGIGVEFSQRGAFIVKTSETFIPSVEDIEELGQKIIKAFISGHWNPRWVVVVRLINAPRATIIISESGHSKLEAIAKGDVASGGIDFGNFNLNFNVRLKSGGIQEYINAKNITPLIQLARLKTSFLGAPGYEVLGRKRGLTSSDLLTPANATNDPSISFEVIEDEDSNQLVE